MTRRRPTYRSGPASRVWERDVDNRGYWPRHKAWVWTPPEHAAAVLIARHGATS